MRSSSSPDMQVLMNYLIILIPMLIIQVVLLVAALIHIFHHDRYRVGSRMVWVLVVIFLNTIGPILYFVIGRGQEDE